MRALLVFEHISNLLGLNLGVPAQHCLERLRFVVGVDELLDRSTGHLMVVDGLGEQCEVEVLLGAEG